MSTRSVPHLSSRWLVSALAAVFALAAFRAPAAAAATPSEAPARATGMVTGRVLNIGSGQYLNNARVTLKGTNNTVFTDKDGTFRLIDVPGGEATLEVFYTDLDLATVQVLVPAGGAVEKNVSLTSVARYGKDAGTITLDAFVVLQDKETDDQAIATNEQRFAPNIKNVMSTDSLGDVLGGSVGEFIKFLPGVTVENDLADVAGISVRGIGGAMTSITNDGAPASNIWVSTSRTVDIRSMALNDISRIELSKVPTPSTPSDSLAGSVNMISKSSFERSGRLLRYSLNLVGNSENLTLKRTPHSHCDRKTYKILPGANLDFTWPITKTFGIVIAGTHAEIYNEQHRTLQTWTGVGTGHRRGQRQLRRAVPLRPRAARRPAQHHPQHAQRESRLEGHAKLRALRRPRREPHRHAHRFALDELEHRHQRHAYARHRHAVQLRPDFHHRRHRPRHLQQQRHQPAHQPDHRHQHADLSLRQRPLAHRVRPQPFRLAEQAPLLRRRLLPPGHRRQPRTPSASPTATSPAPVPASSKSSTTTTNSSITATSTNYRGTTANNSTLNNRSGSNNGYVNVRRSLTFMPVPTAVQVGYSRARANVGYRATAPRPGRSWVPTASPPNASDGALHHAGVQERRSRLRLSHHPVDVPDRRLARLPGESAALPEDRRAARDRVQLLDRRLRAHR